MADVITRLRVENSEYDQKIKRASRALTEMTAQAKRAGDSVAFSDKKNIQLAQSLGKMQTVATSAKGKMAELSNAFIDATHSYNRLSQAEKASPFGRALKQSVDQLQTRVRSLRTEMDTTQRQLNKGSMGGGIGSSLAGGLSAGLSMFGPYAMAAAGVTAAVSGMKKVIGDVVNINMQFEQSSANLAAVMGTTRDQVTALTTQAKQLGATTQYTAVQITELQTNLARLGFTQQEILNSTKSVQALATATGADLGDAANLAGAALRSFGLDSREMERVASVLAVSTTKSALSFEKLATAVPIVSPVAKQFGFTIEDTVTLLGKLSDAGFDASMAATATRNIFLNMANSSGKLAQALGRPIHSIEDLAPALQELKAKGVDLAEMLELTDKRSVAAFATFLDSAHTMEAFKTSVTDCSDALQGMVDEQLNTLQGSVTIMKSAWEGLMLTFSESNGTIKSVVDGLTALLGAWTKWRKRNQGGDEAIKTYELTEDAVAERAKAYLKADKDAGMSDSAILKNTEAENAALIQQRDELRELLDLWQKRHDLIKSGKSGLAKGEEFAALEGISNTTDEREKLTKKIAQKNDTIAINDYIISSLTPASTPTVAGASGSSTATTAGGKGNVTADLRAKYAAEEKARIASLDRMAMSEEEYEQKVYEIKRTYAQMTVDLYNEGTKERYQAEAALSNLEIQHQARMMRGRKKEKTEAEGPAMAGPGMSQFEKLQQSIAIKLADQMASADNSALSNLMTVALQNGIDNFNPNFENLQYQMAEGLDIPDEAWLELADKINNELKNLGIDPIELDVKTGSISTAKAEAKGTADAWQNAVAAVQNVGDALQQIEDPAAKVSGIVMQAVANIALGFAQAAASPATGAAGVFGWIAAATAGVATMASTIAAIKSATSGSYASGGIIPGNNLSGDNLTASVNSGELILNRAQQSNIADQLTQGGLNNLHLETSISGETIRVALANSNRRRGGSRGEYAIGK